jgi:hypothetical protein
VISVTQRTHPIFCLLDAAITDTNIARILGVAGREDAHIGPLGWFETPFSDSSSSSNFALITTSQDPYAGRCGISWWRRWITVYRPQLHATLAKHLIPDLANFVLDALAPTTW